MATPGSEKISEVVRKATKEGPQIVTKHGKDSVVVLSIEDYKKWSNPSRVLLISFNSLLLLPLNWILHGINLQAEIFLYELFD